MEYSYAPGMTKDAFVRKLALEADNYRNPTHSSYFVAAMVACIAGCSVLDAYDVAWRLYRSDEANREG